VLHIRTPRTAIAHSATAPATRSHHDWLCEGSVVVFGKPPVSTTVNVTVPPPLSVAASTNRPGQLPGSVTVVAARPLESVVVVRGLKDAWQDAASTIRCH
jgi:hypothetical protein